MNDPWDEKHLERAVTLAVASVGDGGGPFGAVVVRDGVEIAAGANRVSIDLDPTAHAEVVVIRDACRKLGSYSLAGTVLYASCEPCPMCLSAALWARVDRVVFAANRHDAAAAGFDDSAFYDLLEGTEARHTWPTPVVSRRITTATDPFTRWAAHDSRTDY